MPTSTTTHYSFLSPPSCPEDLGMLGSYRVISELGRGGMGFVFLAEDSRLKRAVALKVMTEKIAATPFSRRRFLEEARSMAAVKHDNVVTIYEVNEIEGTPFMAMEMLKGMTVEAAVKQNTRIGYEKVIEYAIQIARGLDAAHSQAIVHRDIKPANIWIEAPADRIKILDFGLALAQVPVDPLTVSGTVVGTPQYLSPEQASSEPLDNRTDLYSLGVVLYEMCTGRLPFIASSVPQQLILTLLHTPTPAHEVNQDVPEPLSRLISRLMEKEPRLRPASARQLESLLRDVATECEAKSEVAQAISKLQSQLLLVKEKVPEPITAKPVLVPSSPSSGNLFSDLASVPVTPVVPAAGAFAPVTKGASASSRSIPIRPGTKTPSKSPTLKYWPWLVAGVGGVLVVGVALFAFIGPATKTGVEPLVVSQQVDTKSPLIPSGSIPTAPALVPEEELAPKGDQNAKAVTLAIEGAITKNEEATPNSTGVAENGRNSVTVEAASTMEVVSPVFSLELTVNPNTEQMKTFSAEPPSEPSIELPAKMAEASPALPVVEEQLMIRTSDRRGADTTVKRGASPREQTGDSISIAIQTRGTLDVQHSYIRFDLRDSVKRLQNAVNVSLLLTIPGNSGKSGSNLRLYGVPQQYPDTWQEIGPRSLNWGNSISGTDLVGIPLLAEVVLEGSEGTTLRVADPRLTDFVRDAGEEFVTFVLAGGAPDNKALHFVSREGSPERAPTLQLDILQATKEKQR